MDFEEIEELRIRARRARLDDDDDEKESSVLDMIVAAAVLKLYEQMSAMAATSAVGFVGDGAGGALGVSVSVTA